MTFNLTPRFYATGRDFGVVNTDTTDVDAIESAFDSDWSQKRLPAPPGDDLLWSPGSETATINLINSARTSVKVYNEEMADAKIVGALGSAALRGVHVEVVMTDQSAWHANFAKLHADGAQVRTFSSSSKAPLYIHAKMVLVDGSKAFVGSENFSVTSLARNRELGIITSDKNIIDGLNRTFDGDYANAVEY
jgi:phosphatidylserine/phosphatidylglycerophosphate/cardiolipin synthase-like enzyme